MYGDYGNSNREMENLPNASKPQLRGNPDKSIQPEVNSNHSDHVNDVEGQNLSVRSGSSSRLSQIPGIDSKPGFKSSHTTSQDIVVSNSQEKDESSGDKS
eukprot:Gb_03359 [translate_table: standard]